MVLEEKASGQRTWGGSCPFSLSGFRLSRALRQGLRWSLSYLHPRDFLQPPLLGGGGQLKPTENRSGGTPWS